MAQLSKAWRNEVLTNDPGFGLSVRAKTDYHAPVRRVLGLMIRIPC